MENDTMDINGFFLKNVFDLFKFQLKDSLCNWETNNLSSVSATYEVKRNIESTSEYIHEPVDLPFINDETSCDIFMHQAKGSYALLEKETMNSVSCYALLKIAYMNNVPKEEKTYAKKYQPK